ncbi:hypothetical protein J437_LFUL016062 [Ladona fulva]|uniref:Endonuclease/exonuclease/phosphatase domain-containing protein n=1 Tax=Ladona fulva TaxID=123851 RepID=A0A8K0KJN4_LADFU|nr:hypothetical protein J437_LFUL016062 [Ladona fulva]
MQTAHAPHVTFVCVYTPTDDAEEEKDTFYGQLEIEMDSIPRKDVKIVLGDFNAKVGKEEAYRETIGKERLHDLTNDNGQRMIDFTMGNLMVVKNHVIIDRIYASDTLKIDSYRRADCDSDHYFVRVKYRQRIAIYRTTGKEKAARRHNASKLNEKTTAQQYEAELEKKLETKQVNCKRESVEGKWNIIKNVLQERADEVLRVKDKAKRQGWFDEEFREIIKKRNEARRKMIERRTRTNIEQFRQKRKEADKLCRRKKRG